MGYAIIEDGKTLLDSGVLSTKPKNTIEVRLRTLWDGLEVIMQKRQFEAVAIEDAKFTRGVISAIALGQARGVAIMLASLNDLPVFLCPPMTIRKLVTGRGDTKKPEVQKAMKEHFRLSGKLDPDVADAIAVALAYFLS